MPSAGAATRSAQVTATTAATPSFLACGTPAPVTGFFATRVGGSVTLSWDAYGGAGFVEIYRTVDDQFPLGSGMTMTNLGSATFVTTLTDTIAGNGRYSYMVILYNAALTASASATVSIDVPVGTLPGLERPAFDDLSCVMRHLGAARLLVRRSRRRGLSRLRRPLGGRRTARRHHAVAGRHQRRARRHHAQANLPGQPRPLRPGHPARPAPAWASTPSPSRR